MEKYYLECTRCGTALPNFRRWFDVGQKCPKCSSMQLEARYRTTWDRFDDLLTAGAERQGLWRYFDFLPVAATANVVSSGEGNVALERWPFLEAYARSHGVNCRVYAHRHDNNPSTGTFKDLAGSMVASVLKEAGVDTYVVATTGNVGVAFARYLAAAGITLYAFIPKDSSRFHDADIGIFGQKVFRVQGDYAEAKRLAAEFARTHGFHCSSGGFDPIRIEAKKTIAYEMLRVLARRPTVYIQALSGGMGPLGVAKGLRDLRLLGLIDRLPRFYLVQTDGCAPMAAAWAKARAGNFPQGWENDYPIYDDPTTEISILATGNPGLYPLVGKAVRDTGGEIVSFPERYCVDTARLVAIETAVRIGPAAAVAVGGFLYGVRAGHIVSGDVVVVSVGEGIRRSPEFALKMVWSTDVDDANPARPIDREKYRRSVQATVDDFVFAAPAEPGEDAAVSAPMTKSAAS